MKIKFLLLVLTSLFTLPGFAQSPNRVDLFKTVYETSRQNHFQPDRFSPEILAQSFFDLFIKAVDPEQLFITKADSTEWSFYKSGLQDSLGAGADGFFNAVLAKFEDRLAAAQAYMAGRPAEVWDLTVEESMPRNFSDSGLAPDWEALKDRWRQVAKRSYLEELEWESQYVPTRPIKEQQKRALNRVWNLYQMKLEKIDERSVENYEGMYVNSFLQSLDPQSGYFSPEKLAAWGSRAELENYAGVGVYTHLDMNRSRVDWVVPGGPAWQAGVKKGDFLVAVGKETGPMVDLNSIGDSNINKSLKGAVGSKARLKVRSADGQEEVLDIVREEVEVERTGAFVLTGHPNEKPVGYLRLPRFYFSENSSSDDVLSCLQAFNEQSLEHMILDLRGNIGGSSVEAIRIIGFFIEEGPAMLYRYASDGEKHERYDEDPQIWFNGSLVILVNEYSASGSELVAGSLQDYQRALIVGTPTYGKGSMQRFIPLSDDSSDIDLGALKLTVGQFFTQTGRSPQGLGIQPDIVIPAPTPTYFGESKLTNRLSESRIEPSEWSAKEAGVPFPLTKAEKASLQQASQTRMSTEPFFQRIVERNAAPHFQTNMVPLEHLDFQDFSKEKARLEPSLFSSENAPLPGFKIEPFLASCNNSEQFLGGTIQRAMCDPGLYESFQIMQDMDR